MEQKQGNYGSTNTEDEINSLSSNEKKFNRENFYKCCKTDIDKRLIEFITQTTMCGVVLAFCIHSLIHSPSCEEASMWSSLLSLVLGVFIPGPKMK